MKLEDIKKRAQRVMKEHKVEKVFATSDGQIFLPGKKQAAEFHATRKKIKVFEIKFEKDAKNDKSKGADNGDKTKTGDDKSKETDNGDKTKAEDDKSNKAGNGTKTNPKNK